MHELCVRTDNSNNLCCQARADRLNWGKSVCAMNRDYSRGEIDIRQTGRIILKRDGVYPMYTYCPAKPGCKNGKFFHIEASRKFQF